MNCAPKWKKQKENNNFNGEILQLPRTTNTKRIKISTLTKFEIGLFNFTKKLIKCISQIVVGAIILIVLANLAPELKIKMPALYEIVDYIIYAFEFCCNKLLIGIKDLLNMF